MAMENEAVVIIEEGRNAELKADGFGCCWSAFIGIFFLF